MQVFPFTEEPLLLLQGYRHFAGVHPTLGYPAGESVRGAGADGN